MPLSIKVNLRVTGHCNQGGRKYMEDMFSVAYQQTSDDKDLEYAFFGIFDGHGGGEAATFAKEHLMDIIVKQKNFWSDKDEDVLRAIRDGYVNTHYAMWRELEKWPRTASGLPSTAGTTASIAFIRKGKIYIGHVGDSGIILGYQEDGDPQWKAKALTKDHKPESGAEMSRIQESGGKVVSKSGVPRVVWNRPRIGHKGPVRRSTHIDEIPFLAVARSLGDLWSYNSELDTFVVSPEPDVKVVTVDVKSHRCLIFGTDGLWNMLTPQAAVSIVQAAERHNEKHFIASQQTGHGTDQQMWINPSKSLVDRALDKWSSTRLRADNTSVVTLMLDPPGPSRGEVLMSRKKETVSTPQSVPLSMISPSACTSTYSPSLSIEKPVNSENQVPMVDPVPQNIQPKTPVAASNVNPDHDYSIDKVAKVVEDKSLTEIKTKSDVERNSVESLDATPTTSEQQQESIQDPEISSSDLVSCEIASNEKRIDKITEKTGDSIVNEKPDSPTKNPDSIPLLETLVDSLSPIFPSQPLLPTEAPNSPANESLDMVRQNGFVNLRNHFNCIPRKTGQFDIKSMLPNPQTNGDKSSEQRENQTENSHSVKVSKLIISSRTELRSAKRRSLISSPQSRVMPATSSSNLQEQEKSAIESRLRIPIKDNQQPETTTTKINDLTGSKRRHSSTQDKPDKEIPSTEEPLTKRRTRSEDQRCPSDENNPVNKEKMKKQKLRWPNSSKKLLPLSSKSRKTTTPSTSCSYNNNIVVKDINNKEKIPSPTSFQRRSLEKKATPVKSIRRPSINSNNRVQVRGNFTLRDWDQSKSSRRSCPERSRHNNVGGNRLSIDQQLLTTPQRWLRSDTIAATPIKTLRSRNVDIAGHTVPPQVAHQYGIAKQNRIASLTGKMKLSATNKLKSASTTPASQVIGGKLKANNVGGLNSTSSSTIGGTPVMARRVKSTPYNPSARSLGTRSRLKRLGK